MNTRLLRKRREPPPHPVWRFIRIAAGALVFLLGIVMLFTPGQGVLAIFTGLWLMSADIRLARRALIRIRIGARRLARKYRTWRARRAPAGPGTAP
jgi:predicted lysophospholipase L1 biosynthesis ABC-type transport system permease subunit